MCSHGPEKPQLRSCPRPARCAAARRCTAAGIMVAAEGTADFESAMTRLKKHVYKNRVRLRGGWRGVRGRCCRLRRCIHHHGRLPAPGGRACSPEAAKPAHLHTTRHAQTSSSTLTSCARARCARVCVGGGASKPVTLPHYWPWGHAVELSLPLGSRRGRGPCARRRRCRPGGCVGRHQTRHCVAPTTAAAAVPLAARMFGPVHAWMRVGPASDACL